MSNLKLNTDDMAKYSMIIGYIRKANPNEISIQITTNLLYMLSLRYCGYEIKDFIDEKYKTEGISGLISLHNKLILYLKPKLSKDHYLQKYEL